MNEYAEYIKNGVLKGNVGHLWMKNVHHNIMQGGHCSIDTRFYCHK